MKRSESLVLFDIDGTLVRGAGLHHKQSLIEGIRTSNRAVNNTR